MKYGCCYDRHLHFTALHQLDQVGEQHIPVSLTEALRVIRHLERKCGHRKTTKNHKTYFSLSHT